MIYFYLTGLTKSSDTLCQYFGQGRRLDEKNSKAIGFLGTYAICRGTTRYIATAAP